MAPGTERTSSMSSFTLWLMPSWQGVKIIAVGAMVARLLACGPAALRLQKELMLRWRYTDLAAAIEYGINAFATAYATGEPREGARAFLDKRAPRFGDPT